MCGVVMESDGREYQTVAELRAIWPVLVQGGHYDRELHEDACLCQIDIQASAAANNARGKYDPDFGGFVLAARASTGSEEA